MSDPVLDALAGGVRVYRPRAGDGDRDAPVPQPPAVPDRPPAAPRGLDPRRRRLGGQRAHHHRRPRRHPHRRARPRLPGRAAARRAQTRPRRSAAGGSRARRRRPSRRWCAAAWLLDVPAALGVAGCAPGYEITPDDLAAAAARQKVRSSARRRGAGAQRLGPALRDDPRPTSVMTAACPGRGRRARAGWPSRRPRAAGADTIAFELPGPGRRARAAARAPGAAGRARHLHHRDARPRGARRGAACTSSPSCWRRCRWSAPPARRCGRSRWCAEALMTHARPAARRVRGAQTYDRLPDEVRHSVRQRTLDTLGIMRRGHAAADQPRRCGRVRPSRAGGPQATRGRGARAAAGRAGRAGQRHPGPFARLRRHPPAVGAAPERVDRPGRAGGGAGRRRRRPRTRPRRSPSAWRSASGSGMAGYDREARNTTFFDRGQHATSICGAIGGAAVRRGAARPGRRGRDRTPSAWPPAWPAGSSRPTARAAPSSGSTAAGPPTPAVTAARLAAHGITGPPTVLEGRFGFFQAFLNGHYDADAIDAELGERWEVPGIFFKPYPANHFTHAGIDAALALRAAGRVTR